MELWLVLVHSALQLELLSYIEERWVGQRSSK
jgi:hypothetical protein